MGNSYKFHGRLLDVSGRGVDNVKIDVTYWQGFPKKSAQEKDSVNSQIGPKLISTTSDKNGRWQIEITTTNQLILNNKDFPFVFTFTKEGLEALSIKNPRIGKNNDINFTDLPSTIDPVKGGYLSLQKQYKSGFWKVTSLPQEAQDILNVQMDNLMQFLKNNPGNTKITIKSSESLPGNADREPTSKTFNSSLARGVLAQKRSDDLKLYILNKLTSLSPTYPGVTIPNIIVEKPIIGKEKWPDEAKNNELIKTEKDEEGNPITNPALLSRYSKEQWVKIYAELQRPNTDCFNNGYLAFDVSVNEHRCNASVYEVYVNNILLKRDDGKPFASLNNNWINPDNEVFRNGYALVNKVPLAYFDLDLYDNARPKSSYHYQTGGGRPDRSPGRFQMYTEEQTFPTPTTPIPPVQIPTVQLNGGARYNRFLITPQMFKSIKESSGKETLRFTIKCVGINAGAGARDIAYVDGDVGSEGWRIGYGIDCHPGLGDFTLYMLKPDSNSTLKVLYTTDKLAGKTPAKRGEELWLFTFDPCTLTITERNEDVFNSTSLSSATKE
jgi:hypothetical protein